MPSSLITIPLAYGSSTLTIQLPRKNLLKVFRQKDPEVKLSAKKLIERAVQQPFGAMPLDEWSRGRRIAVLVADATRQVPNKMLLQELLPYLKAVANLHIIITTGTHQWNSPDNLALQQSLKRVLSNFPAPHRVTLHDCFAHQWWEAGTTTSGTPIRVNPDLKEVDGLVVISDVKPHYFGGYSNVVKHVVPGVCAFDTAERNHSWTLDLRSRAAVHPWHPDPARRDNPLAADMVEAFNIITQKMAVWVLGVITYHNHLVWAGGGAPPEVMARAFVAADQWMVATAKPADVLVVSCGGYPHDESLYIAQRALELSQPALKKGGRLVFIAECRNGIGPPASIERFYHPLLPPNRHRLRNLDRQRYTMYAHKPLRLWRLIENTQFFGMKSTLPVKILKRIDITPVRDVQFLLDHWIAKEPNLTINVVSDGNKLALHT